MSEKEAYICEGCGKPELDCSKSPCDDVIIDRNKGKQMSNIKVSGTFLGQPVKLEIAFEPEIELTEETEPTVPPAFEAAVKNKAKIHFAYRGEVRKGVAISLSTSMNGVDLFTMFDTKCQDIRTLEVEKIRGLTILKS